MIVRDHYEHFERCLESALGLYDELCVSIDSRSEDIERLQFIVGKYRGQHQVFEWENDSFADARNNSHRMATSDICVWLDADDVVEGPDAMRAHILEQFREKGATSLVYPTNYAQDEHGNCLSNCDRERAVRRELYHWEGEVHEYSRATDPKLHNNVRFTSEELAFEIVHDDKSGSHKDRYQRVYERLLRKSQELATAEGAPAYKTNAGHLNSRDLYYLAVSARGVGNQKESFGLFELYNQTFGVTEARNPLSGLALIYYADLMMTECRDLDGALSVLHRLLEVWPDEGTPYQRLSVAYSSKSNWPLAIFYGEQVAGKLQIFSGFSLSPQTYTYLTYETLAIAYNGMMEPQKALEYADRALECLPTSNTARVVKEQASMVLHKDAVMRSYLQVFAELKRTEPQKLQPLIDAAPLTIREHEFFGEYTHEEPSKKSVTFLSDEKNALLDPQGRRLGCGGSEESLVLQAEHLAQEGYKVTVYAFLNMDPCTRNGVRYLPFHHFQSERDQGIVIIWRNPHLAERCENARMRILSVHDFIPESSIARYGFDSVVFETEAHYEPYRNVVGGDGERATIIPAGICPEEYEYASPWRDPYRCIYASRPERGLLNLLTAWPEIRKVHPQAHLYVYTQLDSLFYEWLAKRPDIKEMWGEIVAGLGDMRANGVTFHGYCGQGHINNVMATAGCWLYPTTFDENFCLSAVKAQASGCYPIANCRAALNEVVHPDFRRDFGDFDLGAWCDWACEWIGPQNGSIRTDVAIFASQFDIQHGVDRLTSLFREIEADRKLPKEMVGV